MLLPVEIGETSHVGDRYGFGFTLNAEMFEYVNATNTVGFKVLIYILILTMYRNDTFAKHSLFSLYSTVITKSGHVLRVLVQRYTFLTGYVYSHISTNSSSSL